MSDSPMTREFIAPLALLLILLAGSSAAAAQDDMVWREVEPNNVVFMELQEGRVIIELNPVFAPKTVAQFQRLVLSRFYDGLPFYRVIDGFVAQGGDGSDLGELSNVPLIDAEFEIDWHDELPFFSVQEPDLFAPETGFVDGFPAGRDPEAGKVWLTHCPGTVAMARNDDRDSSRTDFYIVIGQAPRYLDRNLTVFGRVVEGMDVVQRIRRGPAAANGVIESDLERSRIRSMRLGSEMPEAERLHVYVMDTSSKPFDRLVDDRRVRKHRFFVNKPPRVIDVCQVPLGARVTK
ncbi:peptidylprolyl isomerase [Elongatibacter sediminis]|uniref:peptidylprolyl isomerase n=1 Tax=Elongatibacter sediminis TaxID=3119006 RepID=A0AAW9RDC2_9GAMM